MQMSIETDKDYDKNRYSADEKYVSWLNSLKGSTGNSYRYGIIEFCKFTNKTPEHLIEEAREDYNNRVAPWDVGHIKAIEAFTEHIKRDSEYKTNWWRLNLLMGIRSFYKYHKIPVAEISKFNIPSMPSERYADLPALKLEDIRKAVSICGIIS